MKRFIMLLLIFIVILLTCDGVYRPIYAANIAPDAAVTASSYYSSAYSPSKATR